MSLLNHGEKAAEVEVVKNGPAATLARVRLAGELSNGRCRTGESVKLSEIASQYQLD